MGIFDALTTAVAGLQAQSFALQNISGNIANSQTTGYKETDTSFEDLVSAASQSQQTTDGVIAQFGRHQHGARLDPEHDGFDRHGHQRQWLFRGSAAKRLHRYQPEFHRRRLLHARR